MFSFFTLMQFALFPEAIVSYLSYIPDVGDSSLVFIPFFSRPLSCSPSMLSSPFFFASPLFVLSLNYVSLSINIFPWLFKFKTIVLTTGCSLQVGYFSLNSKWDGWSYFFLFLALILFSFLLFFILGKYPPLAVSFSKDKSTSNAKVGLQFVQKRVNYRITQQMFLMRLHTFKKIKIFRKYHRYLF